MRAARRIAVACVVGLILLAKPLATGADPVPAQAPHIPVVQRQAICEVSRGAGLGGIDLVASLAVRTFPRRYWVTMTAIGYAESCGIPDRIGEIDTPYPSVGLWQIRLVHARYLARVTGSTDRTAWIRWLSIPGNNAQAALAVYEGPGGLQEWGAYRSGRWKLFVRAAERAIKEVEATK